MKYYVWISTSTATATITTTHTQKNTVYFNPFKLIVHTCSILSRAELKESIFSRELLSTAPIASSNWGSQEAQVEHNKAVDHTSTCTTDRIEDHICQKGKSQSSHKNVQYIKNNIVVEQKCQFPCIMFFIELLKYIKLWTFRHFYFIIRF